MTSQAALSDAHRDALAFIVAAARDDAEAMQVIQANASPAGLAGTLSACVVHLAGRAGLDAGEWAAAELAAAVAELR